MSAFRREPNKFIGTLEKTKQVENKYFELDKNETVHTSAVGLKRKRNNQMAIHLNCHCDTERNGRRTSERTREFANCQRCGSLCACVCDEEGMMRRQLSRLHSAMSMYLIIMCATTGSVITGAI